MALLCMEKEAAVYCIAETNAKPDQGRKTPEERVRDFEAKLRHPDAHEMDRGIVKAADHSGKVV